MEQSRADRWKSCAKSPHRFARLVLVYILLALLVQSRVDGSDAQPSAHNYVPPEERMIYDGTHERIGFIRNTLTTLKETDNDLVIQYFRQTPNSNEVIIHQIEGIPQYFSDIKDVFIEAEVEYRVQHGRWSDQVILENLYFGLLFGRSGYPNHYYLGDERHGTERAYSRKLERSFGWSHNIFRRTMDICKLAGIYCLDGKVQKIIWPNYELTGTLTDSIQYLTDLEVLNLRGNVPCKRLRWLYVAAPCVFSLGIGTLAVFVRPRLYRKFYSWYHSVHS